MDTSGGRTGEDNICAKPDAPVGWIWLATSCLRCTLHGQPHKGLCWTIKKSRCLRILPRFSLLDISVEYSIIFSCNNSLILNITVQSLCSNIKICLTVSGLSLDVLEDMVHWYMKGISDTHFYRYLYKGYARNWNYTRYDLTVSNIIFSILDISHMPSRLFCNMPDVSHSVAPDIVE